MKSLTTLGSLLFIVFLFFPLLVRGGGGSRPGTIQRVSLNNLGEEGDGNMFTPGNLSANGRWAVFEGIAGNLVPGDTNNASDIFVFDRDSQTIERMSVSTAGVGGNNVSTYPDMTPDGRYVTFRSDATNLVDGDTNDEADIFVHDRQTGETVRVSVGMAGQESNGGSYFPRFSPNGRYLIFYSSADNLITNDTNGYDDVFVYDLLTGLTERVSLSSTGEEANYHSRGRASLSSGGRYVAFQSGASNLVAGDTNGADDIFVHNRLTGLTERVSVRSDGTQGDGNSKSATISLDGRFVGFHSEARLVADDMNSNEDAFVHDRDTGVTERVSGGMNGQDSDGDSEYVTLSANGQWVSFHSDSSNLVPNDLNGVADIFAYNRDSGQMIRVNVSAEGLEANGTSGFASISPSGQAVTFYSFADNLIDDDTNGKADVFVYSPIFHLTYMPVVGTR